MDDRLLNVVREGNANKFKGLQSNEGTAESVIDLDSMILGGITFDGDGVLHIAARFGYLQLINDIFYKLGMLPQRSNAGIASESNDQASAVRSEENSGPSAAESNNGKTATVAEEGSSPSATGNDAAETRISIKQADPVQSAMFLTIRNRSGETCLHEAVRSGHKEVVKLLISVDGDVRQKNVTNDVLREIATLAQVVDYKGISPLYLATKLRRDKIVMEFLRAGSPSDAGPGGRTALHAAVLLGRELTRQLVDWKPDRIGKADNSGNTPLHLMASAAGASVAEILRPPPDANHPDSNGWFPIHVAAANGKVDDIKQLLKAFADCMWSRNASGQSFLHVAVDKKRVNVVDYVRSEQTLFQILNLTDQDGNTALHLAVKSGSERSFCSLMNNMGVCLSISNNEGRTPLDLAISNHEPGLFNFISMPKIYAHLRLARADFGTYRFDEMHDNLAGKVDKAKLSESISKYAGLMAVCAVFILNMSVTAFFSVAGKYIVNTGPGPGAPYSQEIQDFEAISDVIAFASSALSAFCCMFAGLSSTNIGMGRAYLLLAGVSLFIACIAMVFVFAGAAQLPYVDPNIDSKLGLAASLTIPVVVFPLPIPYCSMFMRHAWTLVRRFILTNTLVAIITVLIAACAVVVVVLVDWGGWVMVIITFIAACALVLGVWRWSLVLLKKSKMLCRW